MIYNHTNNLSVRNFLTVNDSSLLKAPGFTSDHQSFPLVINAKKISSLKVIIA